MVVAYIDESDYDLLRSLTIACTSDRSWSYECEHGPGIIQILRESGIDLPNQIEIVKLKPEITSSYASIASYFSEWALQINQAIQDLSLESKYPSAIAFNLMPLNLCKTRVNSIVQGIFKVFGSSFDYKCPLLLMMHNIDWLLRSDAFSTLANDDLLPSNVMAVDIRGYGTQYNSEYKGRQFEISRKGFETALMLSPSNLYKSLIYGTNAYIGHYELKNSHVRTHYNLNEFIKRDNIWEHIYSLILGIVDTAKRILFVGNGIEFTVIERIGDQLKSILGEHLSLEFHYCPEPGNVSDVSKNWGKRFDLAVVMTDLVNTGTTLKQMLDVLLADNNENKPIGAFSIAKMKNSPETVCGIMLTTAITINREYYPNDPNECKLCQIKQPLIEVESAMDFRKISPGQPTPFDFWEISRDSSALVHNGDDAQGRPFAYRIDTATIVRNYGNWLTNVVAQVFNQNWTGCRPDTICTVQGETGEAFAYLVANAIGVSRVVPIDRRLLKKVTPSSGLPRGESNPLEGAKEVLLVDDGINYGQTLMALSDFCDALRIPTIGALIMDSRQNEQGMGRIEAHIGRHKPIICLYYWPAGLGYRRL